MGISVFAGWVTEKNRRKKVHGFFSTIYFTSMIVAEQSGFLLQAYEVNVAFFFDCCVRILSVQDNSGTWKVVSGSSCNWMSGNCICKLSGICAIIYGGSSCMFCFDL